jgi:endo-1,4-beta-D-glucanase Y
MRRRLVTGLVASLALVTASCSDRRDAADVFLEEAWAVYLRTYVHPDGYVLDPRRDSGRVTSEGQGYALLRAVWERDEAAFRRIASWTEAHLQRPDGLHSWLWTPEDGGRIVDPNTATDGDMEIAWALLMAANVFGDDALRVRGAEIVRAVRTHAALTLDPGG